MAYGVQGTLLSLRRWVDDFDWLNFCSTCRNLRAYVHHNACLETELCNASKIWPGSTSLSISLDVLNPITLPITIRKAYISVYKVWECTLVLPPRLRNLTVLVPVENKAFLTTDFRHLSKLAIWGVFNSDPRQLRLPDTLKKLSISGSKFNQPVVGWKLPKMLEILEIYGQFNQRVKNWSLPAGLKTLRLGGNFNKSLKKWVLPDSLITLDLSGSKFNRPIQSWRLPKSLRSLYLPCNFDQPVSNWKLPEGLTFLDMGVNFNQALMGWTLPQSLTTLKMAYLFSQPISGWEVPHGLTFLHVSCNQPVIGFRLPDTLEHLRFGNRFNQPVAPGWLLPSGLKSIRFGVYFNHPVVDLELPSSLETLQFGANFNQPLDGVRFPPSLKTLDMNSCDRYSHGFNFQFPPNLESLLLPRHLWTQHPFAVTLCPSIRTLYGHFDSFKVCPLDGLTKLDIRVYDTDLAGVVLPTSLVSLTVDFTIRDDQFKMVFPDRLECVKLTFRALRNVVKMAVTFPETLTTLALAACETGFTCLLRNLTLPPALETLFLDRCFDKQLLVETAFPPSLRKLILAHWQVMDISFWNMPECVTDLTIPHIEGALSIVYPKRLRYLRMCKGNSDGIQKLLGHVHIRTTLCGRCFGQQ